MNSIVLLHQQLLGTSMSRQKTNGVLANPVDLSEVRVSKEEKDNLLQKNVLLCVSL